MSISLCIATYNRLSPLKECLDSFRDKFDDYPYEIVIADGGSTDGTLEYLRDQEHVNLIEIGKLTGAVHSYNTCFKAAKHKYLALLNDDFLLKPKVFVKACIFMDEHSDISLVSPKMIELKYSNYPNFMRDHHLVVYKSHLIRKSVYQKIGFLDEHYRMYLADLDTFYSILKQGNTMISTREPAIIHKRVHDTLRKDNVKRNQEIKYYTNKWKSLFKRIDAYIDERPALKRRFAFYTKLSKLSRFRAFHRSMKKQSPWYTNLYDSLLQSSVIFDDPTYSQDNDFFLAQKLPKEIL
ncbi:MAG: glycosyltransferase [Candidatus Heimdallarchaeota archaeon]|nr:glycosyltransferase [Candidatus Heimdallarchaeota archaeon]